MTEVLTTPKYTAEDGKFLVACFDPSEDKPYDFFSFASNNEAIDAALLLIEGDPIAIVRVYDEKGTVLYIAEKRMAR